MSLLAGAINVGAFVKTPSHQVVEVLGASGLDFAVIDAEHAPFDRNTLDVMLLAGRAWNLPLLVRVPDAAGPGLSSALDMGAAGVVVPHVHSEEQAREIVGCSKFRSGCRGLSPSPRYAGYGSLGMKNAIEMGDAASVICQIEDREGLENVAEIAGVPGVDALFIGPADLAQALDVASVLDPLVIDASMQIINAAREAGKTAAIFLSGTSEQAFFHEHGVRIFVIGSDQSMLRQGVEALKTA